LGLAGGVRRADGGSTAVFRRLIFLLTPCFLRTFHVDGFSKAGDERGRYHMMQCRHGMPVRRNGPRPYYSELILWNYLLELNIILFFIGLMETAVSTSARMVGPERSVSLAPKFWKWRSTQTRLSLGHVRVMDSGTVHRPPDLDTSNPGGGLQDA
jgi:hypothetical protein